MKLLADFTQDELANITPEQKQQVFLLECADRGIALPASIPAYMTSPEDRADLRPDTVVYCVGTSYSDKFFFNTMDEAKAVADLLTRTSIQVEYDYNGANGKQYRISDREVRTIESSTISAYSMDKYSELKSELKKYNDQKKTVDSNNKRRSEILSKHETLMQEIDNAIDDAVQNVNRVAEFGEMFKQYLEMANQDQEVATRFLLNAHYAEVSVYNDEQLAKIGIARESVVNYEITSRGETND